MTRLATIDPATSTGRKKALLDQVQARMGMVPNIFRVMANAPAVLEAYLGFSQALNGGTLSADLRERIALAVAESNGARYCASAHAAIGRTVGLGEEDILDSRRGTSPDSRIDAILKFAVKLVNHRAAVHEDDLDRLRDVGVDDGEIAEIIANVALNLFTNYFNCVAETEIDFPELPVLT